MALFRKRNNLLSNEVPPAKRGRGRPRKIEQLQQGSEPNTQIVQTATVSRLKMRLSVNKKWPYVASLLIIAIIPAIYFYAQNKNTQKELNNLQNKSNLVNVDDVVKQVGKLVVLPSGEQPTLATISDVIKLQGNPFFASAANGDKVLVYNKAGKAILYRPSLNKIVEMAPLNNAGQSLP